MYCDYFSYEEPFVGAYFKLWWGLTFMGKKRLDTAKQDFFLCLSNRLQALEDYLVFSTILADFCYINLAKRSCSSSNKSCATY
jgi:hypothetical protein